MGIEDLVYIARSEETHLRAAFPAHRPTLLGEPVFWVEVKILHWSKKIARLKIFIS